MSDVLWLLVVVGYGAGCWSLGAVWRDRRALKVEKALLGQIEIQGALIKTQAPGQAVRGIDEDRAIFAKRRDECQPTSLAHSFNKGVIHGLDAARLRIQGWL